MKKVYGSAGYLVHFSLLITALVLLSACRKIDQHKALKDFEQVNLVGTNNEYSPQHIDPTLINAWGIAFSSGGTAWVNAEGGHVSAVLDKEGVTVRPSVNVPSPTGPTGGAPTGIVFNGGADFVLSNGAPARFIFVGADGVLSGWNGAAGNNAILITDNSTTSAYTGLSLAINNGASYLYAADFRANKIQVWDKTFTPVWMSFTDPGMPAGYAPFNIQAVGNWLYVAYAKVAANGKEETGHGKGFVDIFNTDGSFVQRFSSRGALNAPWGIAMASSAFFHEDDEMMTSVDAKTGGAAEEKNVILVGNFGDGYINVYSLNGFFLGRLKAHGKPIQIEGLWAITFPPATATTIDPNRLYFAAGPDDEEEGLFGYITKN